MDNKKKPNSRKKLFVTLGLLFGLAGVGTAAFAGYVLSDQENPDPITQTPGDIVIENNSYSLSGSISDTLQFYQSAAVSVGRLQYDGNPTANLTLHLNVTVGDASEGSYAVGKNISVSVTTNAGSRDAADGYITAPTSVDPQTIAQDDTSYDFDLAFGWGTAFGGSDPCAYFNDGDGSSKAMGDESDTKENDTVYGILNDFKASLAGTTITVTISLTE